MKSKLIALAMMSMMLAGNGCGTAQWTGQNTAASRPVSTTVPTDEQLRRVSEAYQIKEAGEYETALAMFQEILAENPTVTTAYLGIGDIYLEQENYEKAEPAFARAAKLEPRNFDAQYGHGVALQMLNRFIEAIRAYHRALTINPDSFKANLNIAVTYLQINEPQSAVTFAEQAVRLDPASGTARVNLGAAYEKVGRNSEAIEQYLTAMELIDPADTPPVMMNLVNVLAQEKRYREAANTAENLLKIEPSANAYERLGWCWFRLGDYEKSINAYREAVKLDRNHWQSYNGIGVNALNTWLLSKRRDENAAAEAREAFRRSLRLNPNQQKLVTLMSNYGL